LIVQLESFLKVFQLLFFNITVLKRILCRGDGGCKEVEKRFSGMSFADEPGTVCVCNDIVRRGRKGETSL
jgi:hypothetical protein